MSVDEFDFYDIESEELSPWLPCVISGQSRVFLFATILQRGLAAVMMPDISNGVARGDFGLVKIRCRLKDSQKGLKAPHKVMEFHKLRPFVNTCIRNDYLIMCLDATPYDFDEQERKKILLLRNERFGTIVDLDGLVPITTRGAVEVQCRVKSSPRDEFQPIFIVHKFNGPLKDTQKEGYRKRWREVSEEIASFLGRRVNSDDPSTNEQSRKRYTGIVVADFEHESFVWCEEHQDRIGIDRAIRPSDRLIGKWISFELHFGSVRPHVDRYAPVQIVDDVLPTRMDKFGMPEVLVTCEYLRKTSDNKIEYSCLFGPQLDWRRVMPSDRERVQCWVTFGRKGPWVISCLEESAESSSNRLTRDSVPAEVDKDSTIYLVRELWRDEKLRNILLENDRELYEQIKRYM